MRALVILTYLAMTSQALWAQYPQNYYRSPVDIPIYLSGSFAELRSNHFHSGIDIKTQGTEGKKIYAVADGYVSRLKISPYGFGKTIYIAHSNGYTSVYAHLGEFKDPMGSYFREMQYVKESYALDLYLTPGQMKVKKGDVIALSGNSGSSSGPHLHFEIRNSSNQKPINPQLFGFDIKDTKPPVAWWLYTYAGKAGRTGPVAHKLAKVEDGLRLQDADNTLELPAGKLGFSVKTIDRMEGSGSRLDIYTAQLLVDGELVYEFKTESFSFSETRYLNAHIDYSLQEDRGTRVHRLHRLPANRLSMYNNMVNDGWISLQAGDEKGVSILLTDAAGNRNQLNFQVKGIAPPGKQTAITGGVQMLPGRANKFQEEGFSIAFPTSAFYDTVWFQYGRKEEHGIDKCFSPVFEIHTPTTPIHSRATVKITETDFPVAFKHKTVARRGDSPGSYSHYEGSWSGHTFSFKTRTFGDYHLSMDTTAPLVKPKNFTKGQWLRAGQLIAFTIDDEESGIDDYDVYLNGDWLLMEYDFKRNRLSGKLPATLEQGEHLLEIEVADDVNNIAHKTYKIHIQP